MKQKLAGLLKLLKLALPLHLKGHLTQLNTTGVFLVERVVISPVAILGYFSARER